MKLKLKNRLSRSMTSRWRNARPGSVLILVVALLVLLALIGTAYLSATQAERYTSSQNTINTEADLLLQGVVDTLNITVANGLQGSNQYRQPQQEMPNPPSLTFTAPTRSLYYNYDSTAVDQSLTGGTAVPDIFLSSRIPNWSPQVPNGTVTPGVVAWQAFSWPLFKDNNSNYSFDSPFEASTVAYAGVNKGNLVAVPTSRTINGQLYPAMQYYVPAGKLLDNSNNQVPGGGNWLTPSGLSGVSFNVYAGDADGDGIADSPFVKLPLGPIDGITYYVATRVIDSNSAINGSSAWTQGNDVPFAAPSPMVGNNPTTNYGFFRSNIGLQELLAPATVAATPATEIAALNNYRFYGTQVSPTALSPSAPTLAATPVPDASWLAATTPSNFNWYSEGDALERQLTARNNNPGLSQTNPSPITNFQWAGMTQTAALGYKYLLLNPNSNISPLEQFLPNELQYTAYANPASSLPSLRTTPYSASQVATWWTANFSGTAANTGLFPFTSLTPAFLNNYQFNGSNLSTSVSPASPLRSLLVGSNGVSNAIPSRLGNLSIGGSVWAASTTLPPTMYKFGDWVTDGTSAKYSYVCLFDHVPAAGTEPGDGTNAGAVGVWAGVNGPAASQVVSNLPTGMPFSHIPIKASINTAPFEQLWLNFCQLMTDSINPDLDLTGMPVGNPQWQPPLIASGVPINKEYQLPMFRNVIRNTSATPTTHLTSSQMLKLRAALAAVNAMDLRDGDDDVTSRRIILTDDTSGTPQYDVEVYGSEIQPYIGQVYVHVDMTATQNFIAIQLLNPYNKPITIGGKWKIGTVDRTASPSLVLTPLNVTLNVTIPAADATTHAPGIAVISATTPSPLGYVPPTTPAPTPVAGLEAAIGKELVILKPRLFSGNISTLSQPTSLYGDSYDEGANATDLVPVDQVDMTTLDTKQGDYIYRRSSDPANQGAWGFVFPGTYTPGGSPAQQFSPDITQANVRYIQLGILTGGAQDPSGTDKAGNQPTFKAIPVVINNTNMAGCNRLDGTPKFQFPFGGFARNADMMQIPFIGSYRIKTFGDTTGKFVEMNSVSMDSSLAQDTSVGDPQPTYADMITAPPMFKEQLGRFCPVGDPGDPTVGKAATLDFIDDPTTGPPGWHYHWAKKIFDYFTVQSPTDEHYPFSDPAGTGAIGSPAAQAKYPPYPNASSAYPVAVNVGSNPETIGVEGLININTAPVPVIAQIPFVTPTPLGATPVITAAQAIQQNAAIAEQIVAYRDGGFAYFDSTGTNNLAALPPNAASATTPISQFPFTAHGPYHSIFDLYKVPGFANQNTYNINLTTGVPGPNQGIFTPNAIGTTVSAGTLGDGVRFDFKERFQLLNNISNLITTRSDTFTCYVLLQGWRNAGTSNPTLVVQRRSAFLLDRGVVTPTNTKPFNFAVPTE